MLRILFYLLGGLGVVIALLAAVSWVAERAWELKVKREVQELFAGATEKTGDRIITEADLQGLPACVQKWLKKSKVTGKRRVGTVRLKQSGVIRTQEGQPWLPFEAVQYYTVDRPGFIWKARVKAAPLIHLVGRDRYFNGTGNMLIKFLVLKTVADGKGAKMNQGALLRFLSEIMWFPSATLSEYIRWEAVDENSARAIMTYKDVTASGVFTFSAQGDPVEFVAKRYRATDDGYSLDTWSGVVRGYREFGGVRIPAQVEVMWKFEAGDFSYFQGEVIELEYDVPMEY